MKGSKTEDLLFFGMYSFIFYFKIGKVTIFSAEIFDNSVEKPKDPLP